MVDVSNQLVVAILTRAPSAGGKSRLFTAIGRPPDPELLRALLLDTLDAVRAHGTIQVVCYTPATAEAELRAIVPADAGLLPQREGDLGQRMRGVFEDLLQLGARAVLVLGSDVPLVPSATIARANDILSERCEAVVIGPATDGGYYVIGATYVPSPLFDDVTWGGADVFAQTSERAEKHGIPLIMMPPLADVDTVEDLHRAASAGATRTRRWVTTNL